MREAPSGNLYPAKVDPGGQPLGVGNYLVDPRFLIGLDQRGSFASEHVVDRQAYAGRVGQGVADGGGASEGIGIVNGPDDSM